MVPVLVAEESEVRGEVEGIKIGVPVGEQLVRQAQHIEAQHLGACRQEVPDMRHETLGIEGGDQHDLRAAVGKVRDRLRREPEHRLADGCDILDKGADQAEPAQSIKLCKAAGETLGIVEREPAIADPSEQPRHRARRQGMRDRLVKAVAALDVAECLDIELHGPRCGAAGAAFHLASAWAKCYTWALPQEEQSLSAMAVLQRSAPDMSADERALRHTLLALLAVTVARLVWLRVGGLDLYPDEAQYWLWSLTPDWGYFSKPPLVAWLIRASTSLLGDDEAGIRVASPILHFGTALVIFHTARRLYDARVAQWSAIAYATLPGVSASSLLISTDVPLLFCWAVALHGFVRARETEGWGWWIAVGVATGAGLLAKYAMAYWLLSALLFLLAVRDERRHLWRFLVSAALALAIYAPNFFWNLDHRFVSYRHTEANADINGFALHPGAFAEFVGSQFGVFGPVFFATLLVIVFLLRRVLRDRRAQLLAVFALPTLAMMVTVSLLSRAHPNWSAPTYISAAILVVAFLIEHGRAVLVTGSVILHVALVGVLLPARDIAHAVGWNMPGRLDPVHRLRGWARLGHSVSSLLRERPDVRVVSDNREVLAALSYYVEPRPFAVLKWNPGGGIHDQFDISADAKSHVGENFLYVGPRPALGNLPSYFADVGSVGRITIPLGGDTTREFLVVRLNGFKGY